MCSVQSSLLFLYYVVFSVMSVQHCLCISRIQCTQWSVSVYSVGSVLQRSMQVVFRVISSGFFKHSVIGQNLQHTQSMVFSVSWVTVCGVHGLPTIIQCQQCSVQYSVVGFRVYSVQCQFSVCSVQGVQCSPSVLFSVCRVQSIGCSPRVCHVHVMFRVHTLNFLCPCAVLEF